MQPDQRRILEQAATSGLIGLWRALLPLKTVVTFLQTGAHPDDETTRLLARLRSDGLRLAYACATRGQGGQNSIGHEAGPDLGLLRTAEMEAAARILDLDLIWLGIGESDAIADFGFSKSGEDTLARWGAERVLERLVRAIRTSRPDIVCPTFLDVGGQHGHHRAITRMTEEAFHRAADPAAFPEHRALGLEPWSVAKYYLPAFGGAGGSYDDEEPPRPATLLIDIGTVDPMFGATPLQIGEWSRIHHLSQAMGTWHPPGPAETGLHLKASRIGTGRETSILDRLPQRLTDLSDAPALREAQAAIDEAFAVFPDHVPVARALARAHRALSGAAVDPVHAHRTARTARLVERALAEALLVVADLTVTPSRLTPGGTVEAMLTVAPSPIGFAIRDAAVEVPEGWHVAREDADGHRFRVTAPEGSPSTDPFRFAHDPKRGLGALAARLDLSFEDVDFSMPVVPGEPAVLGPVFGVEPRPNRLLFRVGSHAAGAALAIATTGAATSRPRFELGLPAGWQAEPAEAPGSAAAFRVIPGDSLEPGLFDIPILVDGEAASTVTRVAYDHIRPIEVARRATVRALALAIDLPEGVRIGHIAGGSDRVGEDLAQLGLAVNPLSDAELAAGDFARFDTILVGVFALRTRSVTGATLSGLRTWIESGGNLVTLYHRPMDNWPADAPPMPIAIGMPSLRWRVTDPAAPVTPLLPDHPIFTRPNRIGPADWQGWVKERGLYFASRWDPAYEPLVSVADPGEQPHRGALLAGRFGRGRHVHVALALHTQLANLVPGGYRLMANLLAKPF
jgi:LmbE family N-acetylglucosaminyl deacetylase